MPPKVHKLGSEPVMSDATILVSVENLINIAMGPQHTNVINYKMLQKVLHILARQMRMLETQVELRFDELDKHPRKKEKDSSSSPTTSPKHKARKDGVDDRDGKGKGKDAAGAYGRDRDKRDKAGKGQDAAGVDGTGKDKKQKDGKVDFDEKGKGKSESKSDSEERERGKKGKDGKSDAEDSDRESGKMGKDGKRDAEGREGRKMGKDGKIEGEERGGRKMGKGGKSEGEEGERRKMGKDGKSDSEEREGRKVGKDGKSDSEERERRRMGKDGKSESEEREGRRMGKDGKSDAEEREGRRMGKDGKSEDEESEREKGKGGKAGRGRGRDGEGLEVVEKGPTTRTGSISSRTRVGSIEVVTMSQFEILESLVNELKEMAGPLPMPAMPDNKQLRSDLARGSASLAQTMEAMQVQARMLAAEQAIERLIGMVTALASAGVLPEGVAAQFKGLKDFTGASGAASDAASGARSGAASGATSGAAFGAASGAASGQPSGQASAKASGKSVAIDPAAKAEMAYKDGSSAPGGTSEDSSRPRQLSARPSVATSHASMATFASKPSSIIVPISHSDMDDAILGLKADLMKNITSLTAKAAASAENAASTAKSVSDKLDTALQLNARITHLHEMVTDYAEQLNGFDAGLTTQMSSFNEQMTQMRSELKAGLEQLETANNNAETAAVMELTERYEALAQELDTTVTSHQLLAAFQRQLGDELRALLEAVEMLREQKSDRDEVIDGLRDKADLSRLNGLLSEQEFIGARAELEKRLDLCYEKFKKQENAWMGALKELTAVAENKAELMQLLAAKEEAENALNDIQDKLRLLFMQLGEPKAAILTRLLSRGGLCGSCRASALMEARDPQHGQPPRLPRARPRGGATDVCAPEPTGLLVELQPPHPSGLKEHACLRWAGGSHTLLQSAAREQAPPAPLGHAPPPTRKYTGVGDDGRLYRLEEELLPCAGCNRMTEDEPGPTTPVPETGAGDNVVTTIVVAENLEKPVE